VSGATKCVRVRLAALTRVEYTEVIEVPADVTQDQLEQLVNKRYSDVDGGDYVEDDHYWEPGHCFTEAADEGEEATGSATFQADAVQFTPY